MKKCSRVKKNKCLVGNIEQDFICFSKDKQKKDGLQSTCRICRSGEYQEKKEVLQAKARDYHLKNKKRQNKKSKEYKEKNRSKCDDLNKEWRNNNKEQIKNKAKKYYQENKKHLKNEALKKRKLKRAENIEYAKKYREKERKRLAEIIGKCNGKVIVNPIDASNALYILFSRNLMLYKCGMTSNSVKYRVECLNRSSYGNTNDWFCVLAIVYPINGVRIKTIESVMLNNASKKGLIHKSEKYKELVNSFSFSVLVNCFP